MNPFDEQDDFIFDDQLDAKRDIIRQSLDEIANDIGMAMRDVGLTFPVYMTVRNSGDALVTIATTLDPSDADWQQASEIVCRIIEEKVGCGRLRGQDTALRYCERRGDKCGRRDGRLIRFATLANLGWPTLQRFSSRDFVVLLRRPLSGQCRLRYALPMASRSQSSAWFPPHFRGFMRS